MSHMTRTDKLREKAPDSILPVDISWPDIIAGMLLAWIINSAVIPVLVPVLINHNAPGFDQPDIRANVGYEPTGYEQGQRVPTYNNITWDSDFRVYSITISNEGNKRVRNLLIESWLPGCVRTYSVFSTRYGEEVRVEGPRPLELSNNPEFTGQTYQCWKRIEIDHLPPNEEVQVDFVMTDEFQRCDLLTQPMFLPIYSYSYEWEKLGVKRTPTFASKVYTPDAPSKPFGLSLNNATRIPTTGNQSSYIYGMNYSNPGKAIESCLDD